MSLHPFVDTKHPVMDLVIVRENEEDLYAGIEHQQTDEVIQCLKLISVPGCERIIRYAFEYARQCGRKKVTCFSKDNIMKQTDGLFHKVFNEIGEEYPEIEKEHWIVDIGAAKIADSPEVFDVVVMQNLYGDIISDVAAQIAGSVGLAGSANIGETCSMVGTIEFADAVIANLGKKPEHLPVSSFPETKPFVLPEYKRKQPKTKTLVGVDLFVHWSGKQASELAEALSSLNMNNSELSMITNRGIKVWPNGFEETFCTDHWRCRFKPSTGKEMQKAAIIELLKAALDSTIDIVKTENLYEFDGVAGYSLGQGQ